MISWIASTIFGVHYSLRNFRICQTVLRRRLHISGEPEAYFRMSPEDWLRAEMQGEIVALVHSHPGGLPWLSEADRRLQV
ncbi:Mov34/MPN/PAD-1 family protein, partial [Escherichia coli]